MGIGGVSLELGLPTFCYPTIGVIVRDKLPASRPMQVNFLPLKLPSKAIIPPAPYWLTMLKSPLRAYFLVLLIVIGVPAAVPLTSAVVLIKRPKTDGESVAGGSGRSGTSTRREP